MKILIVSGFLGAGKTTFIKELIRRSGVRPVIMENEYGENDLDARELEKSLPEQKEMKILEFMEGCVCCTMKDRFVNSVLTVFSGLEPEFLVIEPTGVGRLSSIIENLKPILHDNIRLLQPVVALAPQTYRSNMAEFPELYGDQIAHAGVVVFSKGEREDPAFLAETAAAIRERNPRAEIVSEHYTARPDAWWRERMELPAEVPAAEEESAAGERFSQLTLHTANLRHPAELVVLLEDCLRGEFGRVVRAKGVIPAGGEMLRFDLADRQYAVTSAPDGENQCVFIGTAIDAEALSRRLGTSPADEGLRRFASPSPVPRKRDPEKKTLYHRLRGSEKEDER